MYNVGYLTELYWDGRAKGLENNVLAAWTGQVGGKPEEVAKRLGEIEGYATAFQDAYGARPDNRNIVLAMAAFLRGLRSGNSAYDRFKAGQKDALSEAAKAGLDLFSGKAALAYKYAAEIPKVIDSQFCYCYCKKDHNHKTLLTCFTSTHGSKCDICMDEVIYAHGLYEDGLSLDQIVVAVDKKFYRPYKRHM